MNPSKFQKVMKYALFYSNVIVLKKKYLLLCVIAVVRDLPVLEIYGSHTNIMIGETFMHLKASLFDHHHSLGLHHITPVFVPFFFSYPN